MSSYSFSHQFYQHWTGAPEPVRAAIVQELTDITELLQSETPFEKFVFSIHDLDAHLDDLYCAYELQQAEKKRIADENTALEAQQKLAEQRKTIQEEQEKEDIRQQEMAEKRQKQQAALAADLASKAASVVANNTDNANNEESEDDGNNRHNDKAQVVSANSIKAVSDSINQSSAIDLSLADSKLNATHKDMIHELEMHIDDYLTDEMLQMSENLKSWLRAEVSRQLAEKQQTAADVTDK
ncbi:hypothetical protein [Psychrobacter sp. TAE2020]|uniref:hypothetical protein n=1 Tax=Psychrobacter sp. TAE2020 TaxID=2846762 RepID=UPI001E595DB6|nr:hypothetical protein [Psychrobacter sp. TAE2020]